MNIDSISLSYIFFAISIFTLVLSLYFRVIVIKTAPGSKSRNRIIGNMKDPMTWREKNSIFSYAFIFWSFISICLSIYFKFVYSYRIISTKYLFIYLIVISLSILYLGHKKKAVS